MIWWHLTEQTSGVGTQNVACIRHIPPGVKCLGKIQVTMYMYTMLLLNAIPVSKRSVMSHVTSPWHSSVD
jgi:hypothetical protein